ncbi:MAG TPA: nitroreductase family protein [bacterium]|nr:nitroreductase family protein [bacterium]HQC50401.1 nitroreductase family protein [bacterium]HQG12926.1 nitroreductase family protein [bacterium]
MELREAISKRRSVRQFDPTFDVGDEVIRQVLESAVMAPSAGNGQSWHFEVVRDAKIKEMLASNAAHQLFIAKAPVIIVVCIDYDRAERGYGARGRDLYSIQETAAAIENMLLTITSLDLGSCWIGAFDEAVASDILSLSKKLRPVAMLPIGRPAEPAKRVPPRLDLSDVVVYK